MLRGVQRGILGGTFDPPHLAHLFAGEAAHGDLGLDVVTFLPAGAPWQKAGTAVSAPSHRLAMTQLAIDGVDHFEIDDREIGRDGWTYTIETLSEFAGDEVTLILGADAAAGMPTWHRAADVLASVRIAVLPRPGTNRVEADRALDGGDVVWLDTPEVDVSGTAIRRRVAADLSVRFLVPDPVLGYIADHGLYR